MVWIYGGVSLAGFAAVAAYDDTALARLGVVVTFNYPPPGAQMEEGAQPGAEALCLSAPSRFDATSPVSLFSTEAVSTARIDSRGRVRNRTLILDPPPTATWAPLPMHGWPAMV
jgi:hypothetical protein